MTSLLMGKQGWIRARASKTKPSPPMYAGLNAEETKLQMQVDNELDLIIKRWREDCGLDCEGPLEDLSL